MHTFDGRNTRIHFNSDMSGDCEIIEKESGNSVKVPCGDIFDFIADYVRGQKIGDLEQMSSKDIFGI